MKPTCLSNDEFRMTNGVFRAVHSSFVIRHSSLLFASALVATTALRAAIPEPDNILYGTITFSNALITASNTDIIIEARRTPGGPPIAFYRMGEDSRVGNFYSLRVTLESVPPVTNALATQTGETLFIVVTSPTQDLAQSTVTIGQRGAFTRLDFGALSPDADADGLPDAWELAWFGNLGQNGNGDPDNDRCSNGMEYIVGSNPNAADGGLQLAITQSAGQVIVSFFGKRAQGPGYQGTFRLYSLQYSTNLAAGVWLAVPGYTNLLGNNLSINYQLPTTTAPRFFRAQVSLQRP